MKKNLKKIIMPIIILGILMMPISPVFKNNNGNLTAGIETNKAEAYTVDDAAAATSKVATDFKASITTSGVTSGSVDVSVLLESTRDGAYWAYISKHMGSGGVSTNSTIQIEISDDNSFSNIIDYFHSSWEDLGYDQTTFMGDLTLGSITDTVGSTGSKITLKNTFGKSSHLNPEKTYYIRLAMEDENGEDATVSNIASIQTLKEGEGETPKESTSITNPNTLKFGCGITNIEDLTGCVAGLTYLFYGISAWIAEGMGRFLDFFVYYSTNSSSYTNEFVNKAFSAIRDVANLFFIIALLYVAIKTILNLNVSNNKKLIGTIVIVALLINFSLFFTQVIIDGSNILAKVFYNQITSKDKNGNPLPVEAGGEKSISIGLINKFNPQNIVTTQTQTAQQYYTANKGTFIFITLLAMFVTLYTAFIFLMVALLFVGRVVALWLSMIFAPLAFASYTIPSISNQMGSIGWKGWWNELLKNAFLAPIFIFFLYIIVMFAGFLNSIASYPPGADTIQQLMAVIIPFAILAILLMKAKKMAVTFSGELGAAVSKIGKFAAGAAVGVAAGVAGFAGRKTVGHIAANLSEREGFRNWAARSGKFGKMVLQGTSGIASGSFDLRGVKIAGKSIASTGLKAGAVAGVGGFAKTRVEHIKREEAFADKLLDTSDYELARMVRDGEVKNLFEAKTRARDLNEVKRENYAKKIQETRSISKRTNLISASKIRKTAAQQQTQAQIAAAMAALATATPATTTTTTTTTTTPATPAVKP